MKAVVKARFYLNRTGQTDDSNRSSLTLSSTDPNKPCSMELGSSWDLGVVRLRTLNKLTLGIPSGTLELIGEWRSEDFLSDLVFEGEGTWTGKYAGLEGGMSGYGSFNARILLVAEGVFLHPAEPHMDAEIYFRRKEAFFLLHGYSPEGAFLLESVAKGMVPEAHWAPIIESLDAVHAVVPEIKLFHGRVNAAQRHVSESLRANVKATRESRMELAGPDQFGDASESRMELANFKDLGDLSEELEGWEDPDELMIDDEACYVE